MLENKPEHIALLQELLKKGNVKATFHLGVFKSKLASSLTSVPYEGEVTEIDEKSGYCNWVNILGKKMPCVNINCIEITEE